MARSKEILDEFRGRDFLRIDEVTMMVGGVFPTKDCCVVGRSRFISKKKIYFTLSMEVVRMRKW